MFLALAVILLQSPAVPPQAMPVPSTNSAIVSVAAAPETKSEAKIEVKDGANRNSATEISSSAIVEPIILAAPVKRKRAEAARMGVPKMWFVLGAMEHGAATFDAWSTRRNIMEGTMHETNPMMRPFANSNAMYAAVQVAPVLFDLLSKRMLHSSRGWERKTWWVPQTASTVASILSGAHNMSIH